MNKTITINLGSFVIGAITATVLAGGVAYGVIPAASGVISGCWQKNSGQLRVIDPGSGGTCVASEVALAWSQVGPVGPQGPQGPTGPQGVPGAPGAFTGNFISPNGKFSLVVDDDGIFLTTPNSSINMYDGYTALDIADAAINAGHRNAAVSHYGGVEYHFESKAYHHQSFEGYYDSYQYHENVYGYFDTFSAESHHGANDYFDNLEVFNFKNP